MLLWAVPLSCLSSQAKDMGIKEIFNSVESGAKKVSGSLSGILGPVKYSAAASAVPVPPQYQIKDRGVSVTDNDLNAMRPLIYGEISNRTPDKQAMETHVILNTALNRVREYNSRGQKKTLSDVIAMPNQYQAYGGSQYKQYSAPSDPIALAKKKQVDAIIDGIAKQIQSGQYPDTTEGSYYYVHEPKTGRIIYDNKRPFFAK